MEGVEGGMVGLVWFGWLCFGGERWGGDGTVLGVSWVWFGLVWRGALGRGWYGFGGESGWVGLGWGGQRR